MNIETIRTNKTAISVALWVKRYTHALRVLAGVFFVLALLIGVVWVLGKDVESIAYVIGLISSLLFACPSIAEYIVPDQKPIRHMNYEEILHFIKKN